MNEQDYMKITGGIDERFVAEYENISQSRVTNIRKRFSIGIAIAAAVALLIPAGVFAFTQLTHRDILSIYYGEDGVRLMEESNLADGFTVENGNVRLTVDFQMCDGNFASGSYTLTALTEDAKEHIKNSYAKLVYADTGEYISEFDWSGAGDTNGDGEWTSVFTYGLFHRSIDKSRQAKVVFYEDVETGVIDNCIYHEVVEDSTYFEGIYFNLLTEKNVPTKTLHSASGTEIILSPFGVSRFDEKLKESEINIMFASFTSFSVITKDGEIITLIDDSYPPKPGTPKNDPFVMSASFGDGYYIFEFGTYLNLDNIKGVELNGVKYMEE